MVAGRGARLAGRPWSEPSSESLRHGAWVNSEALRLAGIDASTPDPRDGRIERDADGEPTGMLQEGAPGLVSRLLPEVTEDDWYLALRDAQDYLLSLGITGWQDAIIGRTPQAPGQADPSAAYLRAAGAGTLRAHVVGALWWDRARGLEQLPELLHRRTTAGRFRATSVKMMLDGVAENHTAAMLEPYLDGDGCSTGRSGLDFIDPEELPRFVTALDREGFQVHFHALGDRAVRHALDAVAAARAENGQTAARHHLAHLQVIHPGDIPRFAELGATANGRRCRDWLDVLMTLPFSIASRCPVLSIPSGLSRDGVPTGLSVVAKTYDDVTAFRVAAAHEERFPWLDAPARRPCL